MRGMESFVVGLFVGMVYGGAMGYLLGHERGVEAAAPGIEVVVDTVFTTEPWSGSVMGITCYVEADNDGD